MPPSPMPSSRPKKPKRRKKRLQTRARKGTMKGAYKYAAKVKPRKAKVDAVSKIADSQVADAPPPLSPKSLRREISMEEERRMISQMYVVMGAPPPEEWDLKDGTGTVSTIVSALNYTKHQRRKVKLILERTHHCILLDEPYDATRKPREKPYPTTIEEGSEIEQLVADYLEMGLSYTEATMLINRDLHRAGKTTLTRSAIVNCAKHLTHIEVGIEKRPQGNTDPTSDWARARFRWVTQLLIRLGVEVDLTPFVAEGEDIPDCFNVEKLTPMNLGGTVWWDEVHKKNFIGNFREGSKKQKRFLRDDDGKYVKENGSYRELDTLISVKFPKEARFCFGVAIKEVGVGDDREQQGFRLNPYDYTNSTVHNVSHCIGLEKEEIARVKKLSRKTKKWVHDPRPDGALFLDDPVTLIPDVGPAMGKKLNENGIAKVSDLIGLDYRSMTVIANQTRGMSIKTLQKYMSHCNEKKVDGDAPVITYYLEEENPYAAKFGTTIDEWGEEEWKKEIRKSPTFAGVTCISELLRHIVIESKTFYANTEFDSTYRFYHDALSQLTCPCTVAWMKDIKVPGEEVSIYDRWIKPEFGLNDEIGACWSGRPVGNSPELMPLDNSLNQDLHESVRKHVSMSLIIRQLDASDPRLFSMATSKLTSLAYLRIFHPVTGVLPRPDRIVQDINKVMHALKVIHEHQGVYVPGLAKGRTAGKRNTPGATAANNNHGGKRVRLEYNPQIPDTELHTDLRSALDDHGGDITFHFAINDDDEGAFHEEYDGEEDEEGDEEDEDNHVAEE